METAETVVIAKLDKMLALMDKPVKWIQFNERAPAKDENELVIIDKKTKRPVMAYCLVGAAKAAGNGARLYWELAWTIDVDYIKNHWSAFAKGPKEYSADRIIAFNDKSTTEYAMIKSVIRRTRDRIKRRGLLKLPKLADMSSTGRTVRVGIPFKT